jgi:O-antigen/teichoic acid export membrane protein
VLIVLALTMLFSLASHPTMAIVLGLGLHKPIVPVLLAEGLANLALSMLLVQSMGIVGVAWGTAIPAIFRNVFYWPWYMKRVLDISPWTYAQTAWIRPVVSILPYAVVTYLVNRYWPAPSLAVFFLQMAMALPVAFLPLWFVSFNTEQRISHRDFVMTRLPMLVARRET